MAGKCSFLLIIIFFSLNLKSSEIVYNKENILITKQDINQYKLIQNEVNYSNDNIIIKEIVLIKRTIDNLKNNNPKYYKQAMNNIKSQNINIGNVDQIFLEQYLFYINVRNDIAKEFMLNKFEKNQTRVIFKDKDISLGLSNNNCMTIFNTISIEDLDIEEYYKILNREIINFQFEKNIESLIIDVCLSEKIINQIIQLFNNYMIDNSREDFLKFIYEKKCYKCWFIQFGKC